MTIQTQFSREALVLMLKALCAYRDWDAEHYNELGEIIAVITENLANGATSPENEDAHNEL